jgi:hypothetical protein
VDLNPQLRIPDHLDTVLPSGRTVREAVGDRRWVRIRTRPADDLGWLARLFSKDGR